jgi:diaminopimelate epimerase
VNAWQEGDSLSFRKYYAEGNSYVVVEAQPGAVGIADWVSDGLRGLGGDGMIVVESGAGDAVHQMRVFNFDGSEAGWCGNGARAAAAMICERDGLEAGAKVTIACAGGIAQHELLERDDWLFRAEMPIEGNPILEVAEDKRLVQMELGVPHLVVFGPQPEGEDQIDAAGSALCATRQGGTNVMFASHDVDGGMTVTPWERGVGPVLGCATGAAAAAIASEQLLGRALEDGYVRQPGGAICVEWDGAVLAMTGTVQEVAAGTVVLERAESLAEGVPVTG